MTTVYFISDGVNVKIGQSENPVLRLLQLQTGNSLPLRLLYIIENVPEEFEAHTHSVCKRYNIQGEWFIPTVIDHLKKNPWYKTHMKEYIPVRVVKTN